MFTSPDLTSSKVRIGAFALLLCATLLFWVSPQLAQKGAPPPNQLNGLSQLARLTASDGAGSDHFGQTIALSGDTVLVGTPGDNIGPLSNQGSAYVYRRSGNTWTQEAQLLAPDGQGGDSFGIAVAIAGDVAVIGSAFDDNNAGFNAGSVYVFRRTGTSWAFEQQLTASGQQANDRFGSAVAINGDSILVGAPMKTISAQANSGAAYVFRRTVTWTQEAQLLPTSSTANAEFGVSVALQNNTAVVGAAGTNNARGAAYVFTRSGTTWTPQQTLTDAGLQDGDRFGQSVAVDADTALVGAPQGLSSHQGTAFVFTRSGTVWTTQAQLNASDGATGDSFGSSVALYADTALIGAPLDDVENGGTRVDQGSAYVFTRAGSSWTQQERLNTNDGVAEDQAGIAVAIDSQAIVLGAWLKDVGANVDQGAAYVFNVSCPSIQITPASLAAGLPNVAYSQQLSASGGVAPYTFALTNGALPDGITLSAGGLISGTTTLSGSFNITVQVTDTNGCFASRAYTLTTGSCAANITFNPLILAPAPINEVYIQPLLAGGGNSPYFFRVISGALPPGVDLSSPGVLNGTPTAYGTYKFTILATDASGCSGTRNFSLTITCPVITLTPGTVPAATLGVSYNRQLTPFGGAAPHTFTLIGSLPPGLSLSSGGVISGIPTGTGVFNFAAKVVDANGCTVVYPYSLQTCQAILLTPGTIPGGSLNVLYPPVTFGASGGFAPYTFTLNGALPSGMTFNQGTLSGTPFATGTFNFTVSVTDANGCMGINAYSLSVGNCNISLSSTSAQVTNAGGNFVFSVNAPSGCPWTATSTAAWLTVTANQTGTGSLAVTYHVAPNNGAARTGQIQVNNQVFTVTQSARNATTTGVFRPSNGNLYLKNQNTTGFADVELVYGIPGDYPITGDWNGDGVDSIGIYRNGTFYLRNSNTSGFANIVINFGIAGDQPVAGDWDGNGTDGIGIYRNGVFYLRNSLTTGAPDYVISVGIAGDIGIAGDWNGDGIDTIGVFRPSNGNLYLRNTNTTGFADIELIYGLPGDQPIVGDWDGNGTDTIGVKRGSVFYLRNSNTSGFADLTFVLGLATDIPIAGDWDGLP